jgi:hypothetical protein
MLLGEGLGQDKLQTPGAPAKEQMIVLKSEEEI